MNKKSTLSYSMMMYIIKFMFMIVAVVAEVSIINGALKADFDTTSLSINLFYNRLYASSSINYVDPITFRTQIGVIDLDKFSKLSMTGMLEREISYGESGVPVAAKITLYNSKGAELSSYIYNSKRQEGYSEFESKSYAIGKGASSENTYELPVVIRQADKFQNGKIKYDIIAQNS